MNTNLSSKEVESLLALCWMASMADGQRSEPERAEIRRLTESVTSAEIRHDLIYTDVVAGLTTLDDVVAALPDPRLRVQAYEMASCVCISDQDLSKKERTFLNGLRDAFGLDPAVADAIERNLKLIAAPPAAPVPVVLAQSPVPSVPQNVPVASAPVPTPVSANVPKPAPVFVPIPIPTVGGVSAPAPAPAPATVPGFKPIPTAPTAPTVTAADLDGVIRKGATLAAALDSKGDPMCAIGVIPLQRRIITRIGQMLGKEPDRAKTQELMNTLGLSQSAVAPAPAVEATGGYLGKLFGAFGKKAVPAAASEKNTFAQTYALGQFAKRYFAAGQGWSPVEMKQIYNNLLQEAKPVQAAAAAEVAQQVAKVEASRVGEMVASV